MSSRPLRSVASVSSTVALVAGGIALTSGSAQAAIGDPCPAVFPVTELQTGQPATGLTSAGLYEDAGGVHDSRTSPEEFTGTYLETIEDEAGDLLIFQTKGSRITKPNGDVDAGIWSGMSGSPVYAQDGRLIGAVSYTFGEDGGSKFAGVTPAQDMYDLFEAEPLVARRSAPKTVRLSAAEKASLAREGVPARVVSAGLRRLDPVTATGGLSTISAKARDSISRRAGRAPARDAGGSARGAVDIPIVPGGNLAAADSYGSIAAYAAGTATAVCDGQVVGFGHPYNFAPPAQSMHGAKALIVQEAGAYSFKMTNLGAPSGVLTQDRLSGIVGRFGTVPAYPTVSSTTKGSRTRTSQSTVPNPAALSYVVASQAVRDAVLSVNADAGGEAQVAWTINFTPEGGEPQDFTRSQRYASPDSISSEVPNDVAGDVQTILDNEFEEVTINSVKITDDVSPTYRAYKITRVDLRRKSQWIRQKNNAKITQRAGKHLLLRVHLGKADKGSAVTPTTKIIDHSVPKGARGGARVYIEGHGASYDEMDEFGDFDEDSYCEVACGPAPRNLRELLAAMKAQPRQDRVTSELHYAPRGIRHRAFNADAVVYGSFNLRLNVRK